jgi:hypothetical protein
VRRDIRRAVDWALGCDNVFVISSSDVTLFPNILDAAADFTKQPSDGEMKLMITHSGCAPIFDSAKMLIS